jgi:hypothetical protein
VGELRGVRDELRVAVDAVGVALRALRADAEVVRVGAAVDQASAAVAALGPDLTTQVLQRLLADIEHCHRAGLADSPLVRMSWSAAVAALLADPRCL